MHLNSVPGILCVAAMVLSTGALATHRQKEQLSCAKECGAPVKEGRLPKVGHGRLHILNSIGRSMTGYFLSMSRTESVQF